MYLASSPLTYPPSSSPPPILEKRKRQDELEFTPVQAKRKTQNAEDEDPPKVEFRNFTLDIPGTEPATARIQKKAPPKLREPFTDDEDDDDDQDLQKTARMLGSVRSESLGTTHTGQPFVATQVTPDDIWQQPSSHRTHQARTSSGKTFMIRSKTAQAPIPYEKLVAERSTTAPRRATKGYYGVNVHQLLDEAVKDAKNKEQKKSDARTPSIENQRLSKNSRRGRTMLWTEKYRAKKFTDLVGDERTHRDVLRWLKGWDPIVFPATSRLKPKTKLVDTEAERQQQPKILVLAGPPGLGKTTLAHVCARQAGYEVVEINASDERSRDVVKGRIKDCVGTENVKSISTKNAAGFTRKAGRPVCVVVDEVDGVVSGSGGGGEGGFIKALIDLVMLDRKNSKVLGATSVNIVGSKKKGGRFRLLRPIILICNDVYHTALRPLRACAIAEIIHVRRPPLDKVVARLRSVFNTEGVACDGEGVRRLCEATWGIADKRESQTKSNDTGEGDMRGILVVGEWVAAKLRAATPKPVRLTKKWVEEHMLENLSHEGGGARGLGYGGAKQVVERVFLYGAGFPKAAFTATSNSCIVQNGDPHGVSELGKHTALSRLQDVIDTCGESERIVMDCFTAYPSRSFQDDTFLSKPNAAQEWLHFHDQLSLKVYGAQEWELGPYLSQSVLGFHHLFASPAKNPLADQKYWDDDDEEPLPFSGPRADYLASEAQKKSKALLLGLQSSLSPHLLRSFRSLEDISTDLLPNLIRILAPNIKPIVVGGSSDQRGVVSVRKKGEREMVQRAVGVMVAVCVTFERARVEMGQNGVNNCVYRMEP